MSNVTRGSRAMFRSRASPWIGPFGFSSIAIAMLPYRQGRAYVGNFGFDMFAGAPSAPARLAMVHPSGFIRPVAKDLAFPNGMVITPDGKTLIIAESAGGVHAFDIEVDGALMNRRVWADCAGAGPDGICLDEEGAVWIAAPNKRAFIRFREGGEELERIQLPETRQAIACMLGGADRRTLFMCTVEATTQQVLSGSTRRAVTSKSSRSTSPGRAIRKPAPEIATTCSLREAL